MFESSNNRQLLKEIIIKNKIHISAFKISIHRNLIFCFFLIKKTLGKSKYCQLSLTCIEHGIFL